MDKKLDSLLIEIEEKLKRIFGKKISEIILYGSYARGDYDEESDIDILALVKDNNLKRYHDQIIDLEIDLTIKYSLMPSILLENDSNFKNKQNVEYLYHNISEKGKVLYAT